MLDDDDDLRRALIERLDRVLHELAEIDRGLSVAPRAEDIGMIREARRRAQTLLSATQGFFDWATETRLYPPAK